MAAGRYTLWGTPHSLYSGKARSYLIKKQVPFDEVMASDAHFMGEIVPQVGHMVIPVVRTPEGALIQDTTAIIDHIEAQGQGVGLAPAGPVQRVVAEFLDAFGSNYLLPLAMHYRWSYRDRQELFLQAGRLAVDVAAGLPLPPTWSFRRKYFLRLPPSADTAQLPPTTIVLGGFGDVVRYASGHLLVSWYPAGCTGLETGLRPEPEPPTLDRNALQLAMLRGVTDVVPALSALNLPVSAGAELSGGIIYALGRTDVDDPVSRLHQRSETGPRTFGRYHTVDTGKLTTAPYFARKLVRAVFADHRAAS